MESPLGSDLARLVRIWRALIDHRLKPLELTQTHWVTLDQLEDKGLISRQTCASDRRAKRIKLTEKAEPLIAEMEEVIHKTRGEILAGISSEEIELLIKLIAKLEHNIMELHSHD